jgi:hypothetical protein
MCQLIEQIDKQTIDWIIFGTVVILISISIIYFTYNYLF